MKHNLNDISKDGLTGKPPEPFIYFVITCILPKMDGEGKPVLNPDNTPIYEENYFCRRLINKANGVRVIEWDTDNAYAQRFRTETGATNYLRVVLGEEKTCTIKKHPFSL